MAIKLRAPKKVWPGIHLSLLAVAAWIGAGIVAGSLGERLIPAVPPPPPPVAVADT
ncbi:MAG: hypothetical protein HQK87_05955, partial [Nitrospinae bacterium]|nr:hypothetical protein [Nitrospinota bacterium]